MTSQPTGRDRNRRGQGERLRDEMLEVTIRLLDELADDQALSLRAVAREVGIAATSVYLHFDDRDALVLAALERCHADLAAVVDRAERRATDPVGKLRARTLVLGRWAHQHAGLYKVLHESTLNHRVDMPFKRVLGEKSTVAIQRCMDAGLVPVDDAAVVSQDLRAAVHGAVSMRLNQPDLSWPSLDKQVNRFLVKLVGVSPEASRR